MQEKLEVKFCKFNIITNVIVALDHPIEMDNALQKLKCVVYFISKTPAN